MTESRERHKRSDLSVVANAGPAVAPLVKSAGRALEVFEFFDEIKRPARVAEVAAGLNFPQSSTSVLLKCLQEEGYVIYDPKTRTYLPSFRIALLGAWLDAGPVRDGSLLRMLEELSQTTGHTVILATRQGIYSQYVHVIQATTAMRFFVPHGARRLVTWSATGFALLSDSEDEEVRALCLRTNAEAQTDLAMVDIKRVLANVRRARQDGYFFSKGLVTPGAGALAMRLPHGIDIFDRPLAVSLAGQVDQFAGKETILANKMKAAITRYLNRD